MRISMVQHFSSFYSRLVRLEGYLNDEAQTRNNSFYSRLVRLEVEFMVSCERDGAVSIPDWFD